MPADIYIVVAIAVMGLLAAGALMWWWTRRLRRQVARSVAARGGRLLHISGEWTMSSHPRWHVTFLDEAGHERRGTCIFLHGSVYWE